MFGTVLRWSALPVVTTLALGLVACGEIEVNNVRLNPTTFIFKKGGEMLKKTGEEKAIFVVENFNPNPITITKGFLGAESPEVFELLDPNSCNGKELPADTGTPGTCAYEIRVKKTTFAENKENHLTVKTSGPTVTSSVETRA